MSLTLARGPLATGRTPHVNYHLDGPEHLLFFEEFPRRVRAELGGQTVADTRRGRLLHETGLLPVLYVPDDDLAAGVLHRTDHRTHCPFKGDAVSWSVRAGGATAENAAWGYPDPNPSAGWLRGYKAIHWDAMDAWYDEDEQVHGHLRTPTTGSTSAPRVSGCGCWPARSCSSSPPTPRCCPRRGCRTATTCPARTSGSGLRPSDTTAVCPYKGTSSYWSTDGLEDVAWSYEDPLEDAVKSSGHVSFLHDQVTTEIG